MPARTPPRHMKATGRARSNVGAREATRSISTCSVSGACPASHSYCSRMSTMSRSPAAWRPRASEGSRSTDGSANRFSPIGLLTSLPVDARAEDVADLGLRVLGRELESGADLGDERLFGLVTEHPLRVVERAPCVGVDERGKHIDDA